VADANVAAVNYHFGDKLGLYRDVLGTAIATMQATTAAAERAGMGKSAEGRLRAYVEVFLRRVVGQTPDRWIHQLMLREIADPTPAIDQVFELVIRPRLHYLSGIVGELLELPDSHDDVLRCVLSLQAQCHGAIPNPLSHRMTNGLGGERQRQDRAAIDRLSDHIATFSLAGIERVRQRRHA
jgi:AcrR family transcriptional regulator